MSTESRNTTKRPKDKSYLTDREKILYREIKDLQLANEHLAEKLLAANTKTLNPCDPVNQIILEIQQLFHKKNAEYRTAAKWNANFLESAPVANHLMSPMLYCMTLCSKQDDAFWKAVNRSEGEVYNIIERLKDGVVYRLIALTLLKEPT